MNPLTTADEIAARAAALGPWFHNIDLNGVQTAPEHFLNDYPNVKWKTFQHAIPDDLTGRNVLDIGCNAGFYSIEMKRRGAARVLGLDCDPRYLEQAYAHDWTNWWAPNAACSAAMLRSAGFDILENPEAEVFVCRRSGRPTPAGAVYPARPKTNGTGSIQA
jgi:hypothetical protein